MAKVVKTQVEFEGKFYDQYVVIEGEELEPWGVERAFKFVGKAQARIDGFERVSGQAKYTHDIQLPGMLYGKILRCPHPHAKIKRIDTLRAERLSGVRAVLCYKNAPQIPWRMGQTFLFDTTLRYAGDEVAVVVADDEEIAEDALDLIEVEYGLLPFVLDPEEALKPEAPKLHPNGNLLNGKPEIYERGDLEKGLKEADVVVEDTYKTQVALHNCMETHGSVALWDGDSLTICDSNQHIFGVRQGVAKALNIPLHKVRVIKKYMGGGFGSKNSTGKYTVMAALLARQTGRPVKIILDRKEENLATGNRNSTVQYLKIGAKRDGTLTAMYLKSIAGIGAYAVFSTGVGGPVRQLYRCPNVRTEEFSVFTNTGPMSAFRAPGYVEGTFALESLIDQLAEVLQIDPLELRLKNYTEHDQISGRPYSTKGLREAYRIGAEKMGWATRAHFKKVEGSKRRGMGMASQIWDGNGSPPAYALVKLNSDGTATVISGTQDIGTGTKTALVQIAAEELGFSIESISIEIGDTQTGPYAPLSAGSMTLASVGPAVRAAAQDAKKQLIDTASQVLQALPSELTVEDSFIVKRTTNERTHVKEILSKLGNFMIIGKGARGPNPEKFNVNAFGAQFAEVEVDTETGEVTINKLIAVHDSGRVINPLLISSQIEGGVIQGLGFALTEARIVDRVHGIVLNPNLEDYKIPTALDVPEIEQMMIDRADVHANNLGVKGVGEPPIIPTAAAIANAVYDAIGVRIKELPITRDKILRALNGGHRA